MEPVNEEHEVYSAVGNGEWYASSGFGSRGQQVTVNYLAKSKGDAEALAHGLGIARDIHGHTKMEHIGSEAEYREFL